VIGDHTLIAPHAYPQGLGGLRIGCRVGIGAGVLMLTAVHAETPSGEPITAAPFVYRAIEVADGCDLGVGRVLLPGTRLAKGVQVGANDLIDGRAGSSTTATARATSRGHHQAALPRHPVPAVDRAVTAASRQSRTARTGSSRSSTAGGIGGKPKWGRLVARGGAVPCHPAAFRSEARPPGL
jgi:hypothetical protein